jgi:four helix bundle protein
MHKSNPILERSEDFAVEILDYTDILMSHHRYAIANQLVRSGTAIGTLMHEAQYAESRADFIHKARIAAKEAGETFYWLRICLRAKSYPDPQPQLYSLLDEIQRMLGSIIATAKANQQKDKNDQQDKATE